MVTALSDYPEFIPVVARWHWEEWGHTDPRGSLTAWTAGLARQASADRYRAPWSLSKLARRSARSAWSRWICLDTSRPRGYRRGSAACTSEESARRRGYGALLMSRCETWAGALGHGNLYLYTERDSGAEQPLHAGPDGSYSGTTIYDGIEVSVMRKSLASI